MNTWLVIKEQSFGERLTEMRDQVLVHTRRRAANVVALMAGDVVALTVALLAASLLRFSAVAGPDDAVLVSWVWALLPVYATSAALAGLYPGWGTGAVEELRRATLLLIGVFGLAAAALFLTQQALLVSRLVIGLSFVLSVALLPLVRARVKAALIMAGAWGVPTVIYGAGEAGRRVADSLRAEAGLGFIPTAFFDDDSEWWGREIDGIPVVGGTGLVTSEAPVAVLAMPSLSRERIVELLEGPLACYPTVVLVPDLAEAPSLWVRPRDLGGMLTLEITSNLTSPWARYLKRSLDLFATVITVPFWAALCGVIGCALWLRDRQTPFFRQKRIGRDGRVFETLKFRTMVADAEDVLHEYLEANDDARREWEANFKLAYDPRVTGVGRILRRFSLDELPQLVNVLRGEMSLVGPRPLPRYHHEELPPRVRDLRERVRPGLTGLWQISGRSDSGSAGMERWDAYYVRNWSVWLDIVILARTVRAVLKGDGAY